MSIEFRNVDAAPLAAFTAVAPAGAIIGVIGEKNSGLSELLKLAGGVAQPSSGEVTAPPERRYVALGDTLNLAPAAVVALDQALAAQDAIVRARTLTALDRLRRSGSTILIASHEDRLLETLCDEVWWLDQGRIAAKGDPRETLDRYRRFIAGRIRSWGESISPRLAPAARRGNGRAEVISIETIGANGQPTIVFKSGEMMTVRAAVRFHEAVDNPVLGLLIRTQIGFEVYGTNTELERVSIGPRQPGESVTVVFSFLCDLCPHAYTITLASHDPDGTSHDWLEDAIAFTVTDERPTAGVANLRAKVSIEKSQTAL
ncbi:MAG TPA: Wzt carbohydrate-binding domain-containing protein [Bryobacteraceae bacterium]|jgi:ABC-type phosphate/phosphonate transport system ATPase subunit|nr:Wzt carbohydrate-binding domain-containing protein [Bryobacteraceae bacterium]